MAELEFWHEFASTYSYLSAARIRKAAAAQGVEIVWRPFLLGPIFASQGWNTSPFKVYPNKGRYMWRDVERRAARFGVPFKRPTKMDGFPQNGLQAARSMLVGLEEGWGPDFAVAVYRAQFSDGLTISDPEVLARCISQSGGAAEAAMEAAQSTELKQKLRTQSERAVELGLFGAPSFTVGDEVFWGDDRLEDALEWAAAR